MNIHDMIAITPIGIVNHKILSVVEFHKNYELVHIPSLKTLRNIWGDMFLKDRYSKDLYQVLRMGNGIDILDIDWSNKTKTLEIIDKHLISDVYTQLLLLSGYPQYVADHIFAGMETRKDHARIMFMDKVIHGYKDK